MRIAVVHSFYRDAQPSGENRVVEDQVQVLREAGHDVQLVSAKTDELHSRLYPLLTAVHLATGTGLEPLSDLHAFQPDVVHVHNLFPNFATNWTQRWDGPLVVSLHNYRTFCSNGMFFRSGEICTKCAASSVVNSVAFGCYRDSRLATFPVALSRSRDRRNLLRRADAVVTTSAFSNEVMRRFLDPSIKTTVIPNFGSHVEEKRDPRPLSDRWLALGRFTPEKGFVELVKEWPADESLLVIGDGPLRSEIEQQAIGKSVVIKEPVAREEMRNLLQESLGLIFPSRWFEVDPQVVVEAMGLGVPVVARKGNATASIVTDSGAGAVYCEGGSLAAALNQVRIDRAVKSRAASLVYAQKWTRSVWLESMTSLYEDVIAGRGTT